MPSRFQPFPVIPNECEGTYQVEAGLDPSHALGMTTRLDALPLKHHVCAAFFEIGLHGFAALAVVDGEQGGFEHSLFLPGGGQRGL